MNRVDSSAKHALDFGDQPAVGEQHLDAVAGATWAALRTSRAPSSVRVRL